MCKLLNWNITFNNLKFKIMSKKKNDTQYPIGVTEDAMLKSGSDPVEMINEMKKMILERAAELDYHLQTDRHEKSKDGNYRNGSKKLLTDSTGD